MRLLPIGPDHGGRSLPQEISQATDSDIDENLTNICRCGTYPRLRAAIHRAAALNKA